jgi:non-homologous end joining protein Ku
MEAMSKEQKDKVMELCKAKSAGRAVKATPTATAGTVPTDMSDQLQTLTRAIQSLDSSRDGGRRSTDRHTSSR